MLSNHVAKLIVGKLMNNNTLICRSSAVYKLASPSSLERSLQLQAGSENMVQDDKSTTPPLPSQNTPQVVRETIPCSRSSCLQPGAIQETCATKLQNALKDCNTAVIGDTIDFEST